MSEVITKVDGAIIAKDLMDFLDRNGFNSIVRTKEGLKFIQSKTEKPKHKRSTKELLMMALARMSDQTDIGRQARSLVKQALGQL